MKNYYHILGLSFESNPEKELIDAAYKALVKIYHPDVYKGDKKSRERKITEINQAYEILSNVKKKIDYDQNLKDLKQRNPSIIQTRILKIQMFLIKNILMKTGK